MILLGAVITGVFGLWLLCVSAMMVIKPQLALLLLSKMGSTALINATELGLRALAGAGLSLFSPRAPYPEAFFWMGIFLMLSSAVILCVPRHWHNGYARWWAGKMSPLSVRLCAPISVVAGVYLLAISAGLNA